MSYSDINADNGKQPLSVMWTVPGTQGRMVTVDLDRLTTADVDTMRYVVAALEQVRETERAAAIARASELLSRPALGAYRQPVTVLPPELVDGAEIVGVPVRTRRVDL